MIGTTFTCDRCGTTSKDTEHGAANFSEVLIADIVEGMAGKFETRWHLCDSCWGWFRGSVELGNKLRAGPQLAPVGTINVTMLTDARDLVQRAYNLVDAPPPWTWPVSKARQDWYRWQGQAQKWLSWHRSGFGWKEGQQ